MFFSESPAWIIFLQKSRSVLWVVFKVGNFAVLQSKYQRTIELDLTQQIFRFNPRITKLTFNESCSSHRALNWMKEKGIWSFFWILDKCYDITCFFAIIYLLLFFLILPYQSCCTLITKLLWFSCFRRLCNAVRIFMVALKHTKVIIKLIVIFVGWLIGCRRLSVSHPSTSLPPHPSAFGHLQDNLNVTWQRRAQY